MSFLSLAWLSILSGCLALALAGVAIVECTTSSECPYNHFCDSAHYYCEPCIVPCDKKRQNWQLLCKKSCPDFIFTNTTTASTSLSTLAINTVNTTVSPVSNHIQHTPKPLIALTFILVILIIVMLSVVFYFLYSCYNITWCNISFCPQNENVEWDTIANIELQPIERRRRNNYDSTPTKNNENASHSYISSNSSPGENIPSQANTGTHSVALSHPISVHADQGTPHGTSICSEKSNLKSNVPDLKIGKSQEIKSNPHHEKAPLLPHDAKTKEHETNNAEKPQKVTNKTDTKEDETNHAKNSQKMINKTDNKQSKEAKHKDLGATATSSASKEGNSRSEEPRFDELETYSVVPKIINENEPISILRRNHAPLSNEDDTTAKEIHVRDERKVSDNSELKMKPEDVIKQNVVIKPTYENEPEAMETLQHIIEERSLQSDKDYSDDDTNLKQIGDTVPQQETEPLMAEAQAAEPQPYVHPNRKIYAKLKTIYWIQGYYSDGGSIEIYIDYEEISPEYALQELVRITKEKPEKFKVMRNEPVSYRSMGYVGVS